jgi:hypothetical protein
VRWDSKVRTAVWGSTASPAVRKGGGIFAETKMLSRARAKSLRDLCVGTVAELPSEAARRVSIASLAKHCFACNAQVQICDSKFGTCDRIPLSTISQKYQGLQKNAV